MNTFLAVLLSAASQGPTEPGEGDVALPRSAPIATVALGEADDARAIVLDSDPALEFVTLLSVSGEFRSVLPQTLASLAVSTPVSVKALVSESLVSGLIDRDRFVRDHCERLLVQQGERAAGALAPAMETRDAQLLERVLRVIAKSTPRELDRGVRRVLLCHDNERVRCRALAAYAAYTPEDLDQRCDELLRYDLSAMVRHGAAGTLGRSAHASAAALLVEHLDPLETREVRLAIFQALRRITKQPIGRDLEAWRIWWRNHGEEFLRARAEVERAEREAEMGELLR